MQRAECSTVDWSNFFPKIENTATDINSMLPVRHNKKKERRTLALFHFWNQILKSWFEEKKTEKSSNCAYAHSFAVKSSSAQLIDGTTHFENIIIYIFWGIWTCILWWKQVFIHTNSNRGLFKWYVPSSWRKGYKKKKQETAEPVKTHFVKPKMFHCVNSFSEREKLKKLHRRHCR